MKFVVVDLGSSFLKTAIADCTTLSLSGLSRTPVTQRITTAAGRYELDPVAIANAVRQQIQQLLMACPATAGVLITGQMGGLVFVDDHGQPTTPAISWQDTRALDSGSFASLRRQLGDAISSVLGNEFQPGLTLSLLHNVCQAGQSPRGTLCGLPDAVVASLVASRPQMERTSAAGLISLKTGTLANDLISLPTTADAWPDLVHFPHSCGTITHESRKVPVYAATGDHQTALAGSLIRAGELSVNVATGSQMSMLAGHSPRPLTDGQLRPFFDNSWLGTVTHIPAGRALTAVLRLLTEMGHTAHDSSHAITSDDWQYFLQAAETVDRTPIQAKLGLFPNAMDTPGSFGGLTEDCLTVADIARACLERLAVQYQELLPRLTALGEPQRLVFSGGVVRRSRLLQELICQRLGLPFRMAPFGEDALLGLAVLGKVVSGECHCVSDAIATASHQVAHR
ncbi:MAG: FGGY family carbohydrate kinase [Planctomycetaceae bacterium]|nr:FGGY family carbohydrate kinase [Planctomycetaceae bacterium]